jgi:hypothetical protein
MSKEITRIGVQDNILTNKVDIAIERFGGVRRTVLKPVFEVIEPNIAVSPDHLIRVDRDSVADLMTQLWRLGFRPVGVDNNAAEITAKNEHIQDLRTIAFKTLKIS